MINSDDEIIWEGSNQSQDTMITILIYTCSKNNINL